MSDPELVVCPVCASINRVPAAKIGAAPNCGRCSMPLFQGQPTDVDAAAFDRHVGRGAYPFSWISGRAGVVRAVPWLRPSRPPPPSWSHAPGC